MKIVKMGSGERYLQIMPSKYEIEQIDAWADTVMGKSPLGSRDFCYAQAVSMTLHWLMGHTKTSPARLLPRSKRS